jgi:hypothetical protein
MSQHPFALLRSLTWVTAISLLVGCGRASPTEPGPADGAPVLLGPQVLRVTFASRCEGSAPLPLVYSRVTVSRVNSEWLASASSAVAGDVEVRFHATSSGVGGSVMLEGTIKGTAIHMPELMRGLPDSSSRANFGSDGRTRVSAVAFPVTSFTPVAGIDGIGTGAIILSDAAGRTCSGTQFSWGIAAEQ